MDNDGTKKKRIVNCHTHVFTGDHVPPYLAKTFLPWPLYYLVPLSLVVKLFRAWYGGPYRWQFRPAYKTLARWNYLVKIFIYRSALLSFLRVIMGIWMTAEAFFIISGGISKVSSPSSTIGRAIERSCAYLSEKRIIFIPEAFLLKVAIVFCLVILFKPGRNFLFFIIAKIWSVLGAFSGKKSKELAKRYVNLGRFAFYENQSSIFGKLKNQYPEGTAFILLPMDMEYMEAGKLKGGYRYADQMKQLADIKAKNKDTAYPFVFAEPRRMIEEGKSHFDYHVTDDKVVLRDCFIKEYIEKNGFSGFKIYPALGYYPFDEALLPLWKYAADAGLPILTHCIRGTIFYRGGKKSEWDFHPLF